MASSYQKRRKTKSGNSSKKLSETLRKFKNKLKIRKLQDSSKRGRVKTKKKVLSNIAGDTANKLRAESMYSTVKTKGGMSNLGKNYKKSEKNLSEKATKRTAEISKARYPEMGTYKNKDGKSVAEENKNKKSTSTKTYGRAPKRYIKSGTKFVGLKTAQGKKALNKLKAKKRAQEMAKKRLANK